MAFLKYGSLIIILVLYAMRLVVIRQLHKPELGGIYIVLSTLQKGTSKKMEEIKILTPFIKLDQLVKFAGLAETGAKAKILIELGEFNVNGELCTKRGKKIKPGDTIEFKNKKYKIVLDENAENSEPAVQ